MKEIEIPEGYEARIEGNKVILEPKESEDERIRKNLISFLEALYAKGKSAWDGEQWRKSDCADWIAYLEKQEQKPISAVEVLARAGLKPYKDGNQWCILAGDNIQEGICGFGDTIEDALYEFLKEILDLQKEQKPAEWNDTDMKEARNSLISVCRDWEYGKQTTLLPIAAVRARYFLEHLTEPKPAEWSVEEKDNISILLCMIDSMDSISLPSGTIRISGEKRRELKEFIKRPHWKPSEDQMAVLLNAEGLVRANKYTENARILAELYEELKKLM